MSERPYVSFAEIKEKVPIPDVLATLGMANRCYHGRITKSGNSEARWLLTQSCQHVARHPGPLGAFFQRLAKRKNRQVAKSPLLLWRASWSPSPI